VKRRAESPLLEQVRPLVDALARELVAIIESELAVAKQHARDELRSELESLFGGPLQRPATPARRSAPRRSPGKRTQRTTKKLADLEDDDDEDDDAGDVAVVQRDLKPSNVSRAHRCGECEQPGHNARTCPRRRPVATSVVPPAPSSSARIDVIDLSKTAPAPSAPPPLSSEPDGSLPSKPPRPRAVAKPARQHPPPDGWSVEDDRREEWIALSEHLALRRIGL
jgi:hypothetical protein